MKIKKVKLLKFRRPDGEVITLTVPPKLNQSYISAPVRDDYIYFRRATRFPIPQASVIVLMRGSSIAGFLIPGQTLLFNGGIKDRDEYFGTYNLLIAMEVCERSWRGDYSLASSDYVNAQSSEDIFETDVYYGVIQKSRIGTSDKNIPPDYLLSFLMNGLFESSSGKPCFCYIDTDPSLLGRMSLIKNKPLPTHFRILFDQLIPYEKNSVLRFFYVYQAIEILMSEYLDSKYEAVRSSLISQQDISKVSLRKIISDLNDATKEKARINEVLGEGDESVCSLLDELLTEAGEDFSDLTFPLKVYQVRNIVFHDYTRIHLFGKKTGDLANALALYLLRRYQFN